jgi:hypothetical protein
MNIDDSQFRHETIVVMDRSHRAMDRLPLRPPFPVGTRLRYTGDRKSWTYDINPETREKREVPILFPGMEVVIEEVKEGYRGTLRHLSDSEGLMYYEDTGDPILDTTHDGYSIYRVDAIQNGRREGRCIMHDCAGDWELIADAQPKTQQRIKSNSRRQKTA